MIEVEIHCLTEAAIIHYTLDDSEPDSDSPVYTIPLNISETTTIKAKAFKTGWEDSEFATAVYAIIDFEPGEMIFIEGGTFHNGTSNVTLSSFYIGQYEVTQAEYEAVIGTNPSHFSGNPNRPVEQVSWFNAIEYCNRRSMDEGLTPAYSYSTYGINPDDWPRDWNISDDNHRNVACNWNTTGYRLPTEMEWMFAAKGGNQSQGYTYSGSNYLDEIAWYWRNSGDEYLTGNWNWYTIIDNNSRTHDVGTKAPNEIFTHDMNGNVCEWCWDIYGSYQDGDQTNPIGPINGSSRVFRGGSWYFDTYNCTVYNRSSVYATYSGSSIGFRLLRVSQ
jgi:formylglycine-generating enzyme required for sulfatase activity